MAETLQRAVTYNAVQPPQEPVRTNENKFSWTYESIAPTEEMRKKSQIITEKTKNMTPEEKLRFAQARAVELGHVKKDGKTYKNPSENNLSGIEEEYQKQKAEEDAVASEEQKVENDMKEAWDREDKIRKETQEREDNEITRAAADARNAGINLDLWTPQAATSGGGITAASRKDFTESEGKKQRMHEELMAELERAFKGDEGAKNRASLMIASLFRMLGAKKLKK